MVPVYDLQNSVQIQAYCLEYNYSDLLTVIGFLFFFFNLRINMILFTNVSDSSKCFFTDEGQITTAILSATV